MANEKQKCKLHAIIIPLPYQGHINPHLNLAFKLASKGITITFVHFEFIHQMLPKSSNTNDTEPEVDFFDEARKSGLDIHYTTVEDGLPLDFNRALHLEDWWQAMLNDFPARADALIGKIIESDPFSTHFLVADTLYSWTTAVARKYNIVNVSFWTEPALVFSLTYHKDLLIEHGHFPIKDDIEEEINYIPGAAPISTKDMMPYVKESDLGTMIHKAASLAFEDVKTADFVLHNTAHELESQELSALNKYQPHYAIGPVNFSINDLPAITTAKSLQSESDCNQWLDSKPPGSVLYVSFGSLMQISKQVIEETAYGILLSGVNFIWVVRSGIHGPDDAKILHALFKDKTKDKGLIIPWCNQTMVLSHPAVHGFLTHCGWNSILESIWFGIPMICYPMLFDQPVNRKLVVDDWKIGTNLCDGKLVDREKVAEKIKSIMCGTSSEGFKQEIEKVRATMKKAIEVGGSSETNLDQFIKDLKEKTGATTTVNT